MDNTINNSNNVSILKLFLPNAKVKRFQLPETLKEVNILIQKNIPDIQKYAIHFYDEECDYIQIESQRDYDKLITTLSKSNKTKILKLYITEQKAKRDSHDDTIGDSNKIYHSFYFVMKCPLCSRQFEHKSSYIKHAKHCFSVFGMKREPFNSKVQRLGDNQITVNMRINFFNFLIKKEIGETSNYNWRTLSTEFRNQLHKWKQMNITNTSNSNNNIIEVC